MTSKDLVLEHFQRINRGDIAGAATLMAEDCVNHAAVPEAQGRAGFERILSKVRAAFPDMEYTLEDVLVDGDRVMTRVTLRGTQKGTLDFTRLQVPATNKPVKFEQIHLVRVANGKIVEHWMAQDSIAMFRQLGLQISA